MSNQEKKSIGQRISEGLWNPETREFLGRDGTSWGKLMGFYLVYYSALTVFFAITFCVLLATLPEDKPKYYARYDQKRRDAILLDPGMSFVPRVVTQKETVRIEFSESTPSTYNGYVASITNFVQDYEDLGGDNYTVRQDTCDSATTTTCTTVDESVLGPCTASNQFGFSSGLPCLLLRINKIIGFKPVAYTTAPSILSTLVDTHHGSATMYSTTVADGNSNVIVTCQEENFKRRKSPPPGYLNSVAFYPSYGLPFDCFPFCGKKLRPGEDDYLPPYIAAEFNVTRGFRVTIWCRAWFEGAKQSHQDKIGSTRFQLRVRT